MPSNRFRTGSLVLGTAVVTTAAAALVRMAVGDLNGRGPLGPFFLAVLLAAWWGGLIPGLLTTALSTFVAAAFFVQRTGLFFTDVRDAVAVALFVIFSIATSWICETTHRRGRRLKAQEQALRAGRELLMESEERYRLLTEAQPGMVWTLRPDHTVDFVNSAWVAFTGRTIAQVNAEGWQDLIHPDDLIAMVGTISLPLERGEPHEVQVRFRRHDGEYRRVLSRVVPLRNSAGAIVKWIGTTTDVHDLWLAREGLRNSAARLEQSEKKFANVASAPVLIWSSGLDKQYDWFNDSWLAFTGRTLEQEVGDGWLEGVHPQDRERYLDTFARAFDARQPFTMRYRLRHHDGEFRYIFDEGVPRMVGDAFQGYIGSAIDITEQRLLDERMLHSQKMEAIGQLAAGVAHDFNNLLTVINGHVELLLSRFASDDQTRRDLQEVHHAGERAASLTRQLLVFGRKQLVHATVLDVHAEVSESARMLRRLLGEDIELVVSNEPTPAIVTADRNQFAQVLLNLAVNARDAMPQGGRLTFEVRTVELGGNTFSRYPNLKPGPYVRLIIRDSGRGMTSEVAARIFEPFFTTKEPWQGAGLGLAVVHSIIEQADGHIEVSSEPGKGTTFTIYLPSINAQQATVVHSERPDAVRVAETVMLVEDDDAVRRLVEEALRDHGYTVHVASNGGDALKLVERLDRLDLLVTDVVMPGMSGPALSDTLRARYARMRTVFVSGYTPSELLSPASVNKGVAYFQKPFSLHTLIAKVREMLDAGLEGRAEVG